jgi:hypothetical protein
MGCPHLKKKKKKKKKERKQNDTIVLCMLGEREMESENVRWSKGGKERGSDKKIYLFFFIYATVGFYLKFLFCWEERIVENNLYSKHKQK